MTDKEITEQLENERGEAGAERAETEDAHAGTDEPVDAAGKGSLNQNAPDDGLETGESFSEVNAADDVSAQNEISTLRRELADATDRLLRQAAEFQNYRRRTEEEKSQMVSFGKRLVVQQLLDVFDDFERSIEAADRAAENGDAASGKAYDSLRTGIELAYQKLVDELKRLGVEPIESVGQEFDESLHEAVMQQPVADDEESGIVLTEVQRGYVMGDRILRHAKVIVSTRSPEGD